MVVYLVLMTQTANFFVMFVIINYSQLSISWNVLLVKIYGLTLTQIKISALIVHLIVSLTAEDVLTEKINSGVNLALEVLSSYPTIMTNSMKIKKIQMKNDKDHLNVDAHW